MEKVVGKNVDVSRFARLVYFATPFVVRTLKVGKTFLITAHFSFAVCANKSNEIGSFMSIALFVCFEGCTNDDESFSMATCAFDVYPFPLFCF